jgi:polysaccharide biosynthesis protein PslH
MTVSDKEPIRILMLLNRVPYPLNDGGAIAMFSSVKGYEQNNSVLHLLMMNTTKHHVAQEKALDIFSKYGRTELVDLDNRVKPTAALRNLFTASSYIIERFISDEFNSKLIDILKTNVFDVIHVDTLSCTVYIETIRQYSKAKIVYRAHNIESQIWERLWRNEKNILLKWYLKLQAKRLKRFEEDRLKKVDLVLTISKEDEISFKRMTDKVMYVPAGIEIAETQPEQSDSNDLFFIGSFDWQPNLQGMEWFFENVWGQLQKNFPKLRFVIAGKKMPPSIMQRKSKNILPLGEVPDAKQFILDRGIMIVPLVSGSGIRIKIVEAMALGKTIIATTIAAEGLGLTNGENILIADNANEFVTQFGKCLSDPAFRQTIGENAHRFALENFQNKRIFEKLTTYYRQII